MEPSSSSITTKVAQLMKKVCSCDYHLIPRVRNEFGEDECQVTKSISITPSIISPTAPVQVGVEAPMSRSTTIARDIRMKIIGESWASDEDAEDGDLAIWRVDENYAQANGIPRDLRTAGLVRHNGDFFEATVHIEARTGMGMSLFGWPWSGPTPLVVSKRSSFGNRVLPGEVSALEEQHWLQLTKFTGLIGISSKDYLLDDQSLHTTAHSRLRHLEGNGLLRTETDPDFSVYEEARFKFSEADRLLDSIHGSIHPGRNIAARISSPRPVDALQTTKS
ncbi:uncharacterized protein A1O9_10719 [Exophiala aquamarina CBS 119918]|uniref:Uncharacterized protein n=1 Tax=Exophiala aquamarina CBS 119918 TaxID=1182545 RepID=A0A072P0E6_9EURO|nr:uncharacterized protein A1O9_10719 [Exophiala aquamarina CBS 119918]KEF53271.1 hypothetical protein A1O9_10719 [Exophiala aquamarina CBS 119918]